MTIITKGLPSAAPSPLACHVIAASVIESCYLLFQSVQVAPAAFRRYQQPAAEIFPLPNLLRSLLVVPCGRPRRSFRTDLLHSARASQMRISLGSQTR